MPRSCSAISSLGVLSLLSLGAFVAASLVSTSAKAATLSVGAGGTYATPCAAVAAAKAGDVIEIAAGDYVDACKIGVSITLRGVGGMPVISAPSVIPNQKGIFAIEGAETDVFVENLVLQGAKVPDQNGAAIRAQGRNLTVTSCVLRDNENGVLGGEGGVITIEKTVLDKNGDGVGYAHNVYIGTAKKLIFRGNYSRAAKSGHLLKSRADENIVLANRLTGEDGTESYEADFPNGGSVVFAFNLIEQGTLTENPNLLAYGEEGLPKPTNQLAVVFNTFVNNRGKGNETFVLVSDAMKGQVAIVNNIFQGGGKVTGFGAAVKSGNFEGDASLVDAAGFDFHLKDGSGARDKGVDATSYLAGNPLLEYVHPTSFATRTQVGAGPDVGAYEWGMPDGGSAGAGGSSAAGAGGSSAAGAGGSSAAGAGGSSAAGAGGSSAAGAGGSSAAGAGGSSAGQAGASASAGGAGGAGGAGAGSGGGAVTAGNGGTSSGAGGGGGAGDVAAAGTESDDGCGCRVAGSTRGAGSAAAFGAVALGLVALGRRRGREKKAT